jgi:hypothetical protein
MRYKATAGRAGRAAGSEYDSKTSRTMSPRAGALYSAWERPGRGEWDVQPNAHKAWALFSAWERPSRAFFSWARKRGRLAKHWPGGNPRKPEGCPVWPGWMLRLICPGRGVLMGLDTLRSMLDTGCSLPEIGLRATGIEHRAPHEADHRHHPAEQAGRR